MVAATMLREGVTVPTYQSFMQLQDMLEQHEQRLTNLEDGAALTLPHRPEWGVQFHGVWADYTDASRALVLDTLKSHGAQSVRIDIGWDMIEPSYKGERSVWGINKIDAAIQAASSRGLKPLVTLWQTPSWANNTVDNRVPPINPQDYADVCAWAVTQWGDEVIGWEVWNEPNSNDYMRGADPVKYSDMLIAAYKSIKNVSRDATVVGFCTMYVDTPWVKKALLAGCSEYFDVCSVHPYMGDAEKSPTFEDGIWSPMHIPVMYDLIGEKPIWATEYGWSVGDTSKNDDSKPWDKKVTQQWQAEYLSEMFDVVSNWPYVEKLYWYTDRVESQDPEKTGYGLVYADGTPVPALKTAKQILL